MFMHWQQSQNPSSHKNICHGSDQTDELTVSVQTETVTSVSTDTVGQLNLLQLSVSDSCLH